MTRAYPAAAASRYFFAAAAMRGHLHTCNHFVGRAIWLENGGLALLHLEPILAKGIDDVGLMRDNHDIASGGGSLTGKFAEGLRAADILLWRNDKSTLGNIGAF